MAFVHYMNGWMVVVIFIINKVFLKLKSIVNLYHNCIFSQVQWELYLNTNAFTKVLVKI